MINKILFQTQIHITCHVIIKNYYLLIISTKQILTLKITLINRPFWNIY